MIFKFTNKLRKKTVKKQKIIATIRSKKSHQHGQKHRSSSNFSIEDPPAGTKELLWKIVPLDNDVNPDDISCKVKIDVLAGSGKNRFGTITNNKKTGYQSNRHYYIADPHGSGDSGFNVLVYALYDEE
jgi:1-phosphatidylinositol phosphodiesterase